MICDFTPVSLAAQGGGEAAPSNREYFGFIASVFDGDGRLLFQGVSSRALQDQASPTLIEKTREELVAETRRRYEEVHAAFVRARDAYLVAVDDENLKAAYKEANRAHNVALKAFREEMARLTNAPSSGPAGPMP